MQAVLVMFRSDGERRSFSVTRDMTVVGRREDCDLRIPLGDVSRKHARLVRDGDTLRLEDLGSSNGTYLNGQRVQESILSPGDSIQIGPVVFVLQIDGQPADDELNPIRADLTDYAAHAAAPPDMGALEAPSAPEIVDGAAQLEPLADAGGELDILTGLDDLEPIAETPPPATVMKSPPMPRGKPPAPPKKQDLEPIPLDEPIALEEPLALEEPTADLEPLPMTEPTAEQDLDLDVPLAEQEVARKATPPPAPKAAVETEELLDLEALPPLDIEPEHETAPPPAPKAAAETDELLDLDLPPLDVETAHESSAIPSADAGHNGEPSHEAEATPVAGAAHDDDLDSLLKDFEPATGHDDDALPELELAHEAEPPPAAAAEHGHDLDALELTDLELSHEPIAEAAPTPTNEKPAPGAPFGGVETTPDDDLERLLFSDDEPEKELETLSLSDVEGDQELQPRGDAAKAPPPPPAAAPAPAAKEAAPVHEESELGALPLMGEDADLDSLPLLGEDFDLDSLPAHDQSHAPKAQQPHKDEDPDIAMLADLDIEGELDFRKADAH